MSVAVWRPHLSMNVQAAAQFIGAHVVPILCGFTLLLLGLTAILWRFIESRAPALLSHITRHSARLQVHPGFGFAFMRGNSIVRYLGVHALASFAVALISLGTFFVLADEIGIDEDLALFDQALSDALSRTLDVRTLAVFGRLTHLGDGPVLACLGAVVVVLLLVRREWLLAGAFVVVTAGGAVLNRLLKTLFARTRPIHDHGYAIADGWSFPSGHASGSLLVYGMIGYLVVRHTSRAWHLPATAVCMVLLVFVGSSRVLLQVHYFSDVAAGWASAGAWLSMCIAGLEVVRRSRSSTVVSAR